MVDITTLTEEERAVVLAQRAYKKAWRAKNKDKIKASNDRFYRKIAEKQATEQAKEKPSE